MFLDVLQVNRVSPMMDELGVSRGHQDFMLEDNAKDPFAIRRWSGNDFEPALRG